MAAASVFRDKLVDSTCPALPESTQDERISNFANAVYGGAQTEEKDLINPEGYSAIALQLYQEWGQAA